MNLKQIYTDNKKVLDYGYTEWYNEIMGELENSSDLTMLQAEEVTVDLMLSNVLGEITNFDECTETLKQKRTVKDILADYYKNNASAEQTVLEINNTYGFIFE
jgi:hypothetical protein